MLMITYPMEPSQISLISMFTIGVPGFFLAFQPNKERIQGHFLSNVFLKALPAGLTDVLMVGALVVFGKTFGVKYYRYLYSSNDVASNRRIHHPVQYL